jgi:hypothetical protein
VQRDKSHFDLCLAANYTAFCRTMTRVSIGVAIFAFARSICAQDTPQIEISHDACAAEVRLIARDARLQDVLVKLAASLEFQLQFDGSSDALVNLNASMPAATLVAKLSATDSIIVSQSRDPRCPSQNRIDKVWVLAKGGAASKVQPAPIIVRPAVAARNVDEMARQAKEAYQAYIQAHGKPPPGAEEEISKPK